LKLPISQRWNEGNHFTAELRDGKIEVEVTRAARVLGLAATA
jgi:hypothetical protein